MATAGYSGTPLPRKLGVKPQTTLTLVHAPDGIDETLGPLPDGVRVRRQARGDTDTVLAFFTRSARLRREFARLRDLIPDDGSVWIAWPKKSSGVATDLDFDAVQRTGLDAGLVDTKVCAVDATWSGLRFMVRREDRGR